MDMVKQQKTYKKQDITFKRESTDPNPERQPAFGYADNL